MQNLSKQIVKAESFKQEHQKNLTLKRFIEQFAAQREAQILQREKAMSKLKLHDQNTTNHHSTISLEIQKRKDAVYNLNKNSDSLMIKRLLQPLKKNIEVINMTERNSNINGVNSAVASLEGFLDEINTQKHKVKDSSAAVSMNLSKTHSPGAQLSPEVMIKPMPEDILSSVQNEDLPVIDQWHTKS